jgi:hypothetical protein
MSLATPSERRAIGLYAVLARDVSDFIDMVNEANDVESLQVLHELLTLKRASVSPRDSELNDVGAGIVSRNLKSRGVEPRVAPVELPSFED